MIIQYQENFFLDSKFSIVELFRSYNAMFDVDWSPTDTGLLGNYSLEDKIYALFTRLKRLYEWKLVKNVRLSFFTLSSRVTIFVCKMH